MELETELGQLEFVTRVGCDSKSGVDDPTMDETERWPWPCELGAAGSCGAVGGDPLMVFSSQPICSPRLLRVMEPYRSNRSRLGPRASGSWNSREFLVQWEYGIWEQRPDGGACLLVWGTVRKWDASGKNLDAPSGALVPMAAGVMWGNTQRPGTPAETTGSSQTRNTALKAALTGIFRSQLNNTTRNAMIIFHLTNERKEEKNFPQEDVPR